MSDSCTHFKKFAEQEGLKTFKLVHGNFCSPISKSARERKASSCFCYVCFATGSNLFSCLHCVFFGCRGSCITEHLKSKGHNLALELTHGQIYCHGQHCKDFIYPQECQKIALKHRESESKSLGKSTPFQYWTPTLSDVSYFTQNKKRRLLTPQTRLGLRGLLNLGNTCFMNCIVQVLVHTPLLRDYFLAERHHCQTDKVDPKCLVCEISKLFMEFYSGDKKPLSLERLLHLIWNNARHLAGYEQQDAHEFFIAILDLLHRHHINSQQSKDVKTSHSPNCDCIIDQIFTGKLQSDLVCQKCKNVSTTIEPFWDISLDLDSKSKSIQDCLSRFTRPEHLGSHAKINCSACSTHQESTKRLSLKCLPIVASLHLKRFNNSTLLNKKRISSYIEFPLELDLSPFLSDDTASCSSDLSSTSTAEDYRYSLYGVVNYDGAIDSGHYTAFVRHQKGVWVECDDDNIKIVAPETVLKSEGYLLFYHKKVLEYN